MSLLSLLFSCDGHEGDELLNQKKLMVSQFTTISFDNPNSPEVVNLYFKYNSSGDVVNIHSDASAEYMLLDYTADKKINKIDNYKNKKIEYTEVFTYQNNQLEKIVAEYDNKAFNRYIDYTYNDNGKLSSQSICEGPPCRNNKTKYYYEGDNIKAIVNDSGWGSLYTTYDNKYNPFINMNKYLRVDFAGLVPINVNNVLTEETNGHHITYTIDYNSAGFPVKIIGKDEKGNNWVQYNYEYIRL